MEAHFDFGIFVLKTPEQLLSKIEADLKLAKASPGDSALWFNFVVTVAHFPEWLYPQSEGARELMTEDAKRVLNEFPAIEWCYILGTRAKHSNITSVTSKRRQDGVMTGTAYVSDSSDLKLGNGGVPSRALSSSNDGLFAIELICGRRITCIELGDQAYEQCVRALEEKQHSSDGRNRQP